MYYTYVIKSLSLDIFYIGQTNNLSDRINRHNQNRNKYTRNYELWGIINQGDSLPHQKMPKYSQPVYHPEYYEQEQ
ncbi:MAG: hypothetical protein B6D61_11385 [Bacteroidetes bacterium 4484_249]|nr:MAG: hypothetical protein B6D61_11385 [Bacteroidetes bacterium 4484_249]